MSLEVSPRLADDSEGTIAAAHRLWSAVARPNLMIKVPATPAGVPAIRQLTAAGINVNVTLIFSLAQYEAIALAYLEGAALADQPSRLASVASFFVSRVDSMVDEQLAAIGSSEARSLAGKAAIANSKAAYQRFLELFPAGGSVPAQRVLWGSTSTKNPAYNDVRYVEELVGPRTVNTIPPVTLEAFADHGVVRGDTVIEDVAGAEAVLQSLDAVGIDLGSITADLQEDGVASFAHAYDRVLEAIAAKVDHLRDAGLDQQRLQLGASGAATEARLDLWGRQGYLERLWARDPTLWGRPRSRRDHRSAGLVDAAGGRCSARQIDTPRSPRR